MIAVMIAIVIVLGMNLVGSLLISALVIFPTLSAMSILQSFKGVIICSAVISVVCAIVGILASILLSTPIGSTIVAINMVVFFLFQIFRKVLTTLHTLKGGRFLLKEKVEALTTFLICPYASHSGRIGYENLLYFGENCCFLTGSSRALFLDV